MESDGLYYLLTPKGQEGADTTREWTRAADEKGILCLDCRGLLDSYWPVDVRVEHVPRRYTLTLSMFPTFGFIHDQLIDLLGRDTVEKCLILGEVFREDGSRKNGWWTYAGRRRVVVRGEEGSEAYRCEKCRKLFYRGKGRRYVLSQELDGREIYEDFPCCLVISSELGERVRDARIENLEVEAVQVVEKAVDGLPLEFQEQIPGTGRA